MPADRPEPSSPACLAHEADDAYMGYATKDELASFLNELLEAERAGTDNTFYEAKLATARFFTARVLPQTTSLNHQIKAGAATLMAMPAEAF